MKTEVGRKQQKIKKSGRGTVVWQDGLIGLKKQHLEILTFLILDHLKNISNEVYTISVQLSIFGKITCKDQSNSTTQKRAFTENNIVPYTKNLLTLFNTLYQQQEVKMSFIIISWHQFEYIDFTKKFFLVQFYCFFCN